MFQPDFALPVGSMRLASNLMLDIGCCWARLTLQNQAGLVGFTGWQHGVIFRGRSG